MADESPPWVDIATLTGMYMPATAHGVVLLRLPNSQDYFIPLFTSDEHLRSTMAQTGIAFQHLKRIDDGVAFLDKLPLIHGQHRLRVMVDPQVVDGGLQFLEIPRTDPETA